jgi:hypothetical protein
MDLRDALPNVPDNIRRTLLNEYSMALEAHRGGDPGAASVHVAQVCESVIRALDRTLASPHADGGGLPHVNIDEWCRSVEAGDRTEPGISIPLARTIRAAYTFRNKRGAAHTGVDPLGMDAGFTLAAARWLIAEMVRHKAGLSDDDANTVVDELSGGPDGAFARIAGHRYSRYRGIGPLARPYWFADRDSLSALRAVPELRLLGESRLGYLYASAIHEDYDIEFWYGEVAPTVAVARPVAWLATFDGWESAKRARQELMRFPSTVRTVAQDEAAATLYTVDHPRPANPEEAAVLLAELDVLRSQIEELPRGDNEALERLGNNTTRGLVDRLKALLPSTEPHPGTSHFERGEHLDEAAAAFILALCIHLRHRDTDLWRRVDNQSAASASWLADIVARPARASRFRAAAELALYPKPLRTAATTEGCRNEDEITREISIAARSGRDAMLVLIASGHTLLAGHRKAEVQQWVLARYAEAGAIEQDG